MRVSGLPLANAAYVQHGVGCRAPNTERSLAFAQSLRAAHAKAFIGFGDWNVEPPQFDPAWLRYAGLAARSHGLESDGASTYRH